MNTEGPAQRLDAEGTTARSAQPMRPEDPWRQAVDAALVSAGLDCLAPDADPAVAILRLLEWHETTVLDPAISERAQALVERGQASAPQVLEPNNLLDWEEAQQGAAAKPKTLYVYRWPDGRTQVRAPDINDPADVIDMLQEALRAMTEGEPVRQQ